MTMKGIVMGFQFRPVDNIPAFEYLQSWEHHVCLPTLIKPISLPPFSTRYCLHHANILPFRQRHSKGLTLTLATREEYLTRDSLVYNQLVTYSVTITDLFVHGEEPCPGIRRQVRRTKIPRSCLRTTLSTSG